MIMREVRKGGGGRECEMGALFVKNKERLGQNER